MRLNIVNLGDVYGGQEIYLVNLLPFLLKRFDVRLFGGEDLVSRARQHLEEKDCVSLPAPGYSGFLATRSFIMERTSRDDLFIFNGNRAVYLGLMFGSVKRKIAIQHSSLMDSQDGPLKMIPRILLYAACVLRSYGCTVGVSRHSLRPLADRRGVKVVYNGIDRSRFTPVPPDDRARLRGDFEFGPGDRVILMAGAVNPNKGQAAALDVLRLLPLEYHLLVAGDGPSMDELRGRAERYGLAGRCRMPGRSERMPDLYRMADVLLFLSLNEGLPLTILEAMGCGLPVVTTPCGALPEVLREGINCLFVSRDDPAGIAERVRYLMENDGPRAEIVANNLGLVEKMFSLERHADTLSAIILSLG